MSVYGYNRRNTPNLACVDYEALLAPVKPEERKGFIMKAVMGAVLSLEEYAIHQHTKDHCGIFVRFNENNPNNDEALLDSARILLSNLKKILDEN